MKALLSATMAKTKPISFRIPIDLYERLQKVKCEQAHPRLQDTEFLLQATRLYVEHAERFGIDDNLAVKEPGSSYEVKKRPASQQDPPKYKKTGSS